MARIRQEDVDAVRERADIVRLVEQYVGLKKAGRSYSGLCPFHAEKTPSFSVDPAKGVYYCFGCGAGGNAFHFLMQVEGLTFPESVERLAKQTGVTLRWEGLGRDERRAMSRRQAVFRATAGAADLYHRMLASGREAEEARSYLTSRGISREAVEEFGIGYAPGYPDFLLRRMSREVSPEILLEAGLVLKEAGGGVRDRFRSRIVFPAHDLSGRVVGFGARLLRGDGPKYVNSPETPVYRKGELLYNLHRARGAVSRDGRAVVVEGYTDVIALHQGGIEVSVATCGTALSEAHLGVLSRFARRVVLAFDSDEAGARAAERAYRFFENYPLDLSVLVLPEGMDPADLVRAQGADAFEELAAGALPLVEYMLRRAVLGRDLRSPEGRARAVQEALPIVAGLDDPVRREQYAGLLAELTGATPASVLMELKAAKPPAGASNAVRQERRAPARPAAEPRVPSRKVELEVLKILAQEPQLVGKVADDLSEEHFETERHRKAFALLRARPADPADLVERARGEGVGDLMAQLTVEPLTGEPSEEYAGRVLSRLEELHLGRRIADMKKRLQRLNPTTDATYDSLFEELITLESERRDVRARAGEGV